MHIKADRLLQIKEIISKQNISKQEDLLNILHSKDFHVTQATVSRDLKELNIGTKHDNNFGHIYFIPEEDNLIKQNTLSELDGIVSLELANNLAVLKTLPGFANSVAAIIDSKKIETIIGTVAGNDTILIIINEKTKKKEFINSIYKEFSNIVKILKP